MGSSECVDNRRTVLLHQGEELDDNFGRRTDQDLALATLLSVVDVVEAVVQDGDTDHCDTLRNG